MTPSFMIKCSRSLDGECDEDSLTGQRYEVYACAVLPNLCTSPTLVEGSSSVGHYFITATMIPFELNSTCSSLSLLDTRHGTCPELGSERREAVEYGRRAADG